MGAARLGGDAAEPGRDARRDAGGGRRHVVSGPGAADATDDEATTTDAAADTTTTTTTTAEEDPATTATTPPPPEAEAETTTPMPPPTTTTTVDPTTAAEASLGEESNSSSSSSTMTPAEGALRRQDTDATTVAPEDVTPRRNASLSAEEELEEELEEAVGGRNGSSPRPPLPPHIEALINITRGAGEDYGDYDYGAPPSLPPSLPNVKIIPFVAADAVLENGEGKATAYPMQDRHLPTDNPLYSRFSPPIKTEGGFQPREPILDGPFYESKIDGPYDTAGQLQLDITSGTPIPPSITTLPKSEEKVCYSDGREHAHGDLLSEPGACLVCVCHRGEVFCQHTECPAPGPGCTRVEGQRASCCGRLVCDGGDEFPTVVLSGVVPPVTVADGVVTTIDPFRDVIRTEPAPDLPSLIGDLKPYLLDRRPTSTPPTTSSTSSLPSSSVNVTRPPQHEESSLLDSVFQFLFAGVDTSTTTSSTTTARATLVNGSFAVRTEASTSEVAVNGGEVATGPLSAGENATSGNANANAKANATEPPPGRPPNIIVDVDSSSAAESPGLLKLAGCNIYGRMYRVGRIISELSSPCLECRCTEVGVQCRQLKC
ncbi:mucin-2 [Bacillus rossius redtenbacheri]|uniref:mucin-2 n=1 Tax=Bacillus rossius redtenbacheri TaxID=93214 RepID=UPI002FDCCA7C